MCRQSCRIINMANFLHWMNCNAGAIQALGGIVILVLTAALVCVTWWYATLTRDMASTLKAQLAASFQPNIEMKLSDRFQGIGISLGVRDESVSGTITVINKGDLPVKVVAVAMKLVYDKNAFPVQTMSEDARSRVVSPGKSTQFKLNMNVPLDGGSTEPYDQIAQIHCSDLAGVSQHSFSISSREQDQMDQSLGFQPI